MFQARWISQTILHSIWMRREGETNFSDHVFVGLGDRFDDDRRFVYATDSGRRARTDYAFTRVSRAAISAVRQALRD